MLRKTNPIIAAWLLGLLALAGMAQAPAKVRLVATYTPDSWLIYSATIHTTITTHTSQNANWNARLDTKAEIRLHVLSGATPNNFQMEARFTSYKTTVTAQNPNQQAQLQQQSAASDQAATGMKPARFQVSNGHFTILFRQPGGAYDQAVDMLSELARTDELPAGPVAVGATWTRQRTRGIPETSLSMPLTLHCTLTALSSGHGQRTATIGVQSSSGINLPPGSLPDSQQLAREGLVPMGKFSFTTTTMAQFRTADAVLLDTSSQTHSTMHLDFIGPSPKAETSDSQIHSTGEVKLVKILTVPGKR
ncbi:MAG: hypothetical protein ACRD04_02175 [Terriglobales bacterium]